MFGDTLTCGPGLGIEIPVHEKFTEAKQSEGNLPSNAPPLLELKNFRELCEIAFGRILVFLNRKFEPKVSSHFFRERQVGFYVLTRVFNDGLDHFSPPSISLQRHRQGDKRS